MSRERRTLAYQQPALMLTVGRVGHCVARALQSDLVEPEFLYKKGVQVRMGRVQKRLGTRREVGASGVREGSHNSVRAMTPPVRPSLRPAAAAAVVCYWCRQMGDGGSSAWSEARGALHWHQGGDPQWGGIWCVRCFVCAHGVTRGALGTPRVAHARHLLLCLPPHSRTDQ